MRRYRSRRRNPDPIKKLIPIGIVGVLGYVFYQHGEQDLKDGNQTGLAAFSKTIDDTFKGGKNAINQSSGGTPSTGASPCPTQAALAADPNGATNPCADMYGKALWAAQHGGDSSGYGGISRDQQVTWNSVALHGK